MRLKFIQLILGILLVISVSAKTNSSNPVFKVNDKGGLEYLYFPGTNSDTVEFRTDEFAGPSLWLNDKMLNLKKSSADVFMGDDEGLSYRMEYGRSGNQVKIRITCRNAGDKDLKNVQLSLRSGVNTCMTHYPQWRSIYFPTLLRCEKTHFWGYLMSPNGGIITVASPDPIASNHLFYNNGGDFGHGHLIRSFALDLLNPKPLPARNPQASDQLLKGETRAWTIYLGAVSGLEQVVPQVALQTLAPVVTSDFYTVVAGETVKLTVHAVAKPVLKVINPDGREQVLNLKPVKKNVYGADYKPDGGKGVYTVLADVKGKTGEAKISVRYNWSDYAKSARRTALKYPQKGGSHTESWYGMFPAYIAGEYFPDRAFDQQVDEMFNEIYPLMYDPVTNLPTSTKNRIQNHALMAALLAQRYRAHGDIKDMRAAVNLVDFLLAQQSGDGAYRNGKTHYTSVIYIAKAIMEVMEIEQKLAKTSDDWKANYERHYYSVKKAVDELCRNLDNIETEGEMTYEDGMISCSYSQIAMFALLLPEGSAERQKYTDAAEFLAGGHRCLSQLLVPDSRMHGGSLRYWEAQYDILTFPNMMNSPHGWSAWRIYGLKYLYELTGKEKYLTDMMNSLGTCVQLLDPSQDKLNWAFVCDPYLQVRQFVQDENNKGKGKYVPTVIGEQYMPMISDWYRAPKDKWVTGYWGYDGGCCDNDVNEIFKCMGEVALTSAYVHQKADGSFITWNCRVTPKAGKLQIEPAEACVKKVHVNLNKNSEVIFVNGSQSRPVNVLRGWVE